MPSTYSRGSRGLRLTGATTLITMDLGLLMCPPCTPRSLWRSVSLSMALVLLSLVVNAGCMILALASSATACSLCLRCFGFKACLATFLPLRPCPMLASSLAAVRRAIA
jgi:hypothetical protein